MANLTGSCASKKATNLQFDAPSFCRADHDAEVLVFTAQKGSVLDRILFCSIYSVGSFVSRPSGAWGGCSLRRQQATLWLSDRIGSTNEDGSRGWNLLL